MNPTITQLEPMSLRGLARQFTPETKQEIMQLWADAVPLLAWVLAAHRPRRYAASTACGSPRPAMSSISGSVSAFICRWMACSSSRVQA